MAGPELTWQWRFVDSMGNATEHHPAAMALHPNGVPHCYTNACPLSFVLPANVSGIPYGAWQLLNPDGAVTWSWSVGPVTCNSWSAHAITVSWYPVTRYASASLPSPTPTVTPAPGAPDGLTPYD